MAEMTRDRLAELRLDPIKRLMTLTPEEVEQMANWSERYFAMLEALSPERAREIADQLQRAQGGTTSCVFELRDANVVGVAASIANDPILALHAYIDAAEGKQ